MDEMEKGLLLVQIEENRKQRERVAEEAAVLRAEMIELVAQGKCCGITGSALAEAVGITRESLLRVLRSQQNTLNPQED